LSVSAGYGEIREKGSGGDETGVGK